MGPSYEAVIDYLYRAAPLFQNIGAGAYKEGLGTTRALDAHFGHPHRRYHTIHVAGTNGKGSVSSTLAAILQSVGLRVGLYTSPHLVDFRERIRVNGEMISQQRVIDFVEQERSFFEPLNPSFFELTTALAFLYFAEQEVDVAVVEVGLGGRLDCTNIITPDVSIITNISFDHQQFLGNTLTEIAAEKAGVIKPGVPVVIGETNGHDEVREVFLQTAAMHHCRIRWADEASWPLRDCELKGDYQCANMATVQCAVEVLRQQPFYAQRITEDAVSEGMSHVMELTGLRGRWQVVAEQPLTICDVGHNEAGITYVVRQLAQQPQERLHIVFGMVGDKDYRRAVELLSTLRERAVFYLTQPSSQRALPAETLAEEARRYDLAVRLTTPNLQEAAEAASRDARPCDLIFIGGSCYLVADYFAGAK